MLALPKARMVEHHHDRWPTICQQGSNRRVQQEGAGIYTPFGLEDLMQENPFRDRDGVQRLLVQEGEMKALSVVSVDFPFVQGDTVRYAWQFMLPKDFISDAPRNRWWLIGQWHDQPNKKLGETWKDFPSSSPPVALEIAELNGHLGVALVYGQTGAQQHQRHYGPLALERGKWHSITARIHWSRGTDGNASVYLDGSTKATMVAEGPNMNNDFQHYLKLGMYRHPDIPTDNWIFINRVEIAKVKAPLR